MNLRGLIQRWRRLREYCRQLEKEKAQLKGENAQLKERSAWLEARLRESEARNRRLSESLAAAKKDSSTSSKPPSSDIVKASAKEFGKKKRPKRKPGGQKGHPKHEHVPFAPAQVDERTEHRLHACPVDASHRIRPAEDRTRTLQQVELALKPIWITEHTAYGIWCHDCHCYHDAPFPPALTRARLFGPRLTALVCYTKARLHGSYSGIRDLLEAALEIKVSRGYLVKLLAKASRAFHAPYDELVGRLAQQPVLNIDETGHKENGLRYWTWCFRAATFAVFKIARSRGTEVLEHILGEGFKGLLGCDYYAAYRKYARECSVLIQFCLAHLIREVKYLCDFPDPQVQRYGQGLLKGLQALFHTLHRQGQLTPETLAGELAAAQEQIWEAAMAPKAFPARFGGLKPHRLIANLMRRFQKHGEAYFQFITNPEIDPTNNIVEQAVRFVVIDRHITQGTRSERGRHICERLWTVMATCAIQKRSPFQWMCEAITAWFQGRPAPSLLVDSS